MANVPDRRLEELARARGFPDYQTYAAWERHRQNATNRPGRPEGREPSAEAAFSWHPRSLFNYVLDRYRSAVGR